MKPCSIYLTIFILIFISLAVASCNGGDDDDSTTDDGQADDDDATAGDDDTVDDDDTGNDDDTVVYEPCDSPVKIAYDPSGFPKTVPFPNDLFTEPKSDSPTGLQVAIPEQATAILDGIFSVDFTGNLREALNTLNGFSVMGRVYISLPEKPDQSTITHNPPSQDDGVWLIDLDSSDAVPVPINTEWIASESYLTVQPDMPLREATRYALVITDTLQTDAGACYGADDAFDRIRRDDPVNDDEQAAASTLSPLFDALPAWGIDPLSISSATVFTTQDLRSDMLRIAETVTAAPPAGIEIESVEAPPEGWDNVSALVTATFTAPVWRKNNIIAHDAAGVPQQQGNEEIALWIALPEGYDETQSVPVVVYQHGFNRSKSTGMGDIARWLCAAGFAVAAIDLPVHGDRCEFPCIPGIGFLNIFNLPVFRDNSRQGIADHLSLIRALKQWNGTNPWPGEGLPSPDTAKVFYLGHSLGGMVGIGAMTLSGEYQAGAVHASGAGFREIVFNMAQLEPVFALLKQMQENSGEPIYDCMIGLFDLAMWVLEPGDPRSYLPLLDHGQGTGFSELLVQINAWDYFMPPTASYDILYYADLPLMAPLVEEIPYLDVVTAPVTGSVGFQLPTDWHDTMFLDPSVEEAAAAQMQIVSYFQSKIDTGHAEAVDPW